MENNTSKLYINNILIDYVTVCNFLGINIQNYLKWDTRVNSISLKIGRTVGILNKLKHTQGFILGALLLIIYIIDMPITSKYLLLLCLLRTLLLCIL